MASVQSPVAAADNVLSEPPNRSLQDAPNPHRLPASSTPIEMSTMPSGETSQSLRSPSPRLQPPEASHQSQMPASNALPPSTLSQHTSTTPDQNILGHQQATQQPLFANLDFDFQSNAPPGEGHADQSANPIDTTHSPLARQTTAPAIGPATDRPAPLPKESEAHGPVLFLTLLLTTGSRHPFKLDEKYLKKRNVEVEGNNPINLSLYKFKELILRDWREEWEPKPSSPESIRLISMGKLLGDKSKLADFGFKNGSNPHIIHMTIKPQEIVDEEDAKSSARDREGHERSPGCRCVIQ